MGFVVLAIGLVFCVEGLVLALAPSYMEEMLRMITELSVMQRRIMGLIALGAGVIVIGIARLVLGL